jgi:hypothetical protein
VLRDWGACCLVLLCITDLSERRLLPRGAERSHIAARRFRPGPWHLPGIGYNGWVHGGRPLANVRWVRRSALQATAGIRRCVSDGGTPISTIFALGRFVQRDRFGLPASLFKTRDMVVGKGLWEPRSPTGDGL